MGQIESRSFMTILSLAIELLESHNDLNGISFDEIVCQFTQFSGMSILASKFSDIREGCRWTERSSATNLNLSIDFWLFYCRFMKVGFCYRKCLFDFSIWLLMMLKLLPDMFDLPILLMLCRWSSKLFELNAVYSWSEFWVFLAVSNVG